MLLAAAHITASGAFVLLAIVAACAAGFLMIRRRRRHGPGPFYYLRTQYIEDQFKKPDDESELL